MKFLQVEDRLGHDKKYGLSCHKLREYYVNKLEKVPTFINLFDYLEEKYKPNN